MHQVVADLEARTLHIALQKRLFVSASKEDFHVVTWDAVFAEGGKEKPASSGEESEF
jgi:hypothetical protein